MEWPHKDPNETLDYSVDWTAIIPPDDTIDSYEFVKQAGDVVIERASLNGNVTTAWISGGTVAGGKAIIVCKMNTTEGRFFERSVSLKIKEK